MTKKINVLSLFGGIECGRVAIERIGFPVGKYFSSEIDKNAIEITKKNFPDVIHIGSVTDVEVSPEEDTPEGKGCIYWNTQAENDYDVQFENGVQIDLLIGGSPCQDLSKAKVGGKGLDGEKSRLFFEYVRILKEAKPKYFLLENVASMKKESSDEMTRILREVHPETEVHLVNSGLVSAQSRPRLYWTNIPGFRQPKDQGIEIRDILEDIPETDPRWKPLDPKYAIVDGKVRIPEATKKGYIELDSGDSFDFCQPNSTSRRGRAMKTKAHTLTTSQFFHLVKKFAGGGWYVRLYTPTEGERLQTLPDGYTSGVSESKRHKAIGNGWTVEVIVEFLKRCKFDLEEIDTF